MNTNRAHGVWSVTQNEDAEGASQRPPSPLTKKASRLLAVVASIGAAFSMGAPAMAEASPVPVSMTISSNVFPTGTTLPGGLSGTVAVRGGTPVALSAPQYVYEPSTPPGALGTVYEFMFWDVNSTLINTGTADFSAPENSRSFGAAAWYVPVCVVSSSCSGTGPSSVATWAFSLAADKVLPGTPISSVSPPSAWTSPSTSVSTATAVNVVAVPFLGAHTKFSGTPFSSWFVFGGGGSTTSGVDLDVPAGESPYAIAFYNQYSFHLPPVPCPGYPHCI
jgi:hypothetical protein